MQDMKSSPARNSQINSKISVPAKAIPSSPSTPPVKAGVGSVKGFSGSLINPKV